MVGWAGNTLNLWATTLDREVAAQVIWWEATCLQTMTIQLESVWNHSHRAVHWSFLLYWYPRIINFLSLGMTKFLSLFKNNNNRIDFHNNNKDDSWLVQQWFLLYKCFMVAPSKMTGLLRIYLLFWLSTYYLTSRKMKRKSYLVLSELYHWWSFKMHFTSESLITIVSTQKKPHQTSHEGLNRSQNHISLSNEPKFEYSDSTQTK